MGDVTGLVPALERREGVREEPPPVLPVSTDGPPAGEAVPAVFAFKFAAASAAPRGNDAPQPMAPGQAVGTKLPEVEQPDMGLISNCAYPPRTLPCLVRKCRRNHGGTAAEQELEHASGQTDAVHEPVCGKQERLNTSIANTPLKCNGGCATEFGGQLLLYMHEIAQTQNCIELEVTSHKAPQRNSKPSQKFSSKSTTPNTREKSKKPYKQAANEEKSEFHLRASWCARSSH